MSPEFFSQQLHRLRLRFGEKAFDPEFTKLVLREVSPMANDDFLHMIDVMIGSRKHNHAPTLTDFREQRYKSEKEGFNRLCEGAHKALERPRQTGLKSYLALTYGTECKSLWQAVEMQVAMNKIKQATEET